MSQIFRSFEANSGDYLTKMIGESDQKCFAAVGSIDKEKLLASMQTMAPLAQQALIEEQAGRRKALRDKMSELTQQRSSYFF